MNFSSAKLPSLHHGKEGWLRHKSNGAKPPLLAQTGWFSFSVSIGKPPRPRGQRTLRDIFLIARPPLLALMQGGESCTTAIHSQPAPTAFLCNVAPAALECRNAFLSQGVSTMLRGLKWLAAAVVLMAAAIHPSHGLAQKTGPAQWQNDLTPIGPSDWNYDLAAHLLERAGFGGTPEEIQALARLTPAEAVRR